MQPVLGEPFRAAPDVHVIPTFWPVPNVGHLPMNAFVIDAAEPVLVDTGTAVLGEPFREALASVVDLADLRWIWLTHEDRDHTGSLSQLLDAAPQATLVTTFMAVGRILPEVPIPLDRVRLVNPGERLNVGDRNLLAVRPPLYDSPATTGLLDDRSGALFSSDCFGAPMPGLAEASVRDVGEVAEDTVTAAQLAWATVDSPWVTNVDRSIFAHALDLVRQLEPTTVLSSHLPPAPGRTEQLLAALGRAPAAEPVPGLTQSELETLLAGFEPGSEAVDHADRERDAIPTT